MSLQYNIWKQCIEQRQMDELLFTGLLSFIPIFLIILVDLFNSNATSEMTLVFGDELYRHKNLFEVATTE